MLQPLHETPQPPQFELSVEGFTQVPLQSILPAPQTQVPDEQAIPVAHDVPQAPQLLLLLWMFVSQPFDGSPSQSS